ETIAILTSLLTDVLSPDIDLHILLWASDKIGPVFDRFEAAQSKGGETFAWLAKKRTDFLKKGVYESLTQSHPFIVRDFRLLFC
ncbi:TraC family protein, partial [Acinetobacter baumannii]